MKNSLFISIVVSCIFTSNFYTNPQLVQERKNAIELQKKIAVENETKEKLLLAFKKANKKYSEDGFHQVWNLLDEQPLQDKIILSSISYCESGFNQSAVNTKNKNGTTDGGLWQINSVHKISNVKDPIVNRNKTLELYENGKGIGNWNSSKHCWKPIIDKFAKDSKFAML